jgi:peptidyl-prolyl cis-trans isomerase A (cyclophilin A)
MAALAACAKAPAAPTEVVPARSLEPAPEPAPEPAATPAAPPAAPAGDEVRPPVATDLAEYARDIPGDGPLVATITTSEGALHCELHADRVPMTVANFIGLATGKKPWRHAETGEVMRGTPFYDGLTVHRVAPGYIIQMGCPVGNGTGGPGYEFADEVVFGQRHVPGVLAMANRGPGTNGSQFFILSVSAPQLASSYTVFGQCAEVDLVRAIMKLGTGDGPPRVPVTITSIAIERAPTPTTPPAR